MAYTNDILEVIIKTTPSYGRCAKKLFTDKSLDALYDYLSENPTAGNMIRGSGGVRKLRWKAKGSNRGKSGGLRVLYHYSNEILVIMLAAYVKNEQENINTAEKNELKKLLPKLVDKYMEDIL